LTWKVKLIKVITIFINLSVDNMSGFSRNILIIYNPQAGSGRAKALLPEVERYLKQVNIAAKILLTQRQGHAVELAAKADLSTFDAIIASGGDGTLFEVINGYYQNTSAKKPPIGLIPNGTGNAFMKEFNLNKSDWRKAIDIVAQNKTRKLDVGKMLTQGKTYYFINVVGVGLIPKIASAAIPLKKIGNAAYTIATLLKMVRLKSQKFELEIDGQKLERDGIFVEVANSCYTGTTFYIAPKAKLDDGLLDIIILNKVSRFKLLKLFTSIYDGTHVNYPEVEYIQANKIKIIEQQPGQLSPDGELMGKTPVEFECLHQDIEFLWG
jgi:diacylglycerol kinase (ATP)